MAISNAVSLANFTSGDALTIDSANDRVGIASTQPTSSLTVTGDALVSGVVTATNFSGPSGTAPDFPNGASFSGNVSIGGTLTYEDVTNVDSVGVITARTDINLGDSIIHIGDTNTKIRFPAVDTVTVETAGSERLRVDSSGRLLLGTTTEGEATADNFTIADSGHCGITLRSGDDDVGTIFFSDGTSGDAEYEGYIQYDHSGNYIKFATDHAERLRIDSSGRFLLGATNTDHAVSYADNLVIGTTSGDNGMTIVSGTSDAGSINFSDGSGAGETMGIIQYSHSSNDLYFYANSSERMRITSGGDVGINATSPDVTLDVRDPQAELQLKSTTGTNSAGLRFLPGGETNAYYLYVNGSRELCVDDHTSARFKINSSGNVLLGTTTNGSSANLQVGNGGGAIAIGGDATGNGSGYFKFLASNSTTNWQVSTNNTVSGALEIAKSSSAGGTAFNDGPVMMITSSGVSMFKGGLAEKVNVKSQLTSANTCAITDGNVILTTSNEPGNTYPDITGVHSILGSGEGFSVTVALKVNGSGTINQFHIDGVSQTVEWSGGSAPDAGSSGYDVFTFTAIKTGTGTSDYKVFGAAVNYD